MTVLPDKLGCSPTLDIRVFLTMLSYIPLLVYSFSVLKSIGNLKINFVYALGKTKWFVNINLKFKTNLHMVLPRFLQDHSIDFWFKTFFKIPFYSCNITICIRWAYNWHLPCFHSQLYILDSLNGHHLQWLVSKS